jgi:transcriptional regulator with XRE-family HTH domain
MSYHKLHNYLRTYRKRAGLSQDEVAFLLGCHTAAHVSRYEHFHRTPSLRTVLAYQVIFHALLRDLFGGEYQKVERAVSQRARTLAAKLSVRKEDRTTVRKLALLNMIASGRGQDS